MEKKRYEVQIAGAQLAIISDEREEFINTLVENLDSKIREITVSAKRSSNLDAAILCALEYYSEKVKAEKRARNLEAQISLYDANLRRFREENIALREKLEALEGNRAEPDGAPEAPAVGEEEKSADPSVSEDTKPEGEDREVASDEKSADVSDSAEESRAARLRAIEELLGRGGKKND